MPKEEGWRSILETASVPITYLLRYIHWICLVFIITCTMTTHLSQSLARSYHNSSARSLDIALTYLERLFPGVLSDMCPQNAGGCESFVAVHALVRTFSAVNLWKQKELVTRSEMNDKVSRQTKNHHFNRPVFSQHASFQSISYQLVKDQMH